MKNPTSYEKGMNRLEQLLDKMNDPETTLSESLKYYAEAAELISYCEQTLKDARVQVEEISARFEKPTEGDSQ